MQLVNLTPHPITLATDAHGVPAGTYASDGIAHVDLTPGKLESEPEIAAPLPPPTKGTLYAVSLMTAEARPERTDLVIPHDQIRDDNGRIVGCRTLAKVWEVSPLARRLKNALEESEGDLDFIVWRLGMAY